MKIVTQKYNPLVYANLYEFTTAKELGSKCKNHLESLGKELKEHGLNGNVGIVLLHKHFKLYDDEILLRELHDNVMTVRPTTSRIPVSPYIWAFSKISVNKPYAFFPIEYVALGTKTELYRDIATTLENNTVFLTAFFSRISCLGLTNIFGLGLIPGPAFTMNKSDTLVENDEPGRCLKISVTPAATVGSEATQTLWIFN